MAKGKNHFIAGIIGDLVQENLAGLLASTKVFAVIFTIYALVLGSIVYALLSALGWLAHLFLCFVKLTLRDSFGQTDLGKLFITFSNRRDKVKLLEKELAELKMQQNWAREKVASIAGVIG